MKPKNNPDDFTADVQPVNQQEDENGLTEEERAIAWEEYLYELRILDRENY